MQRKEKRIFHRMITGLQIARNNNAYMRFMTLTSAPNSPGHIKKSFDVLKKRIMRAKVEKDGFFGFKFNRYFCLRTSEGHGVLHIVYWGRFIPQAWLSLTWEKIHGAFRVDVRACHTERRKVNGLVGYLLTNYLKKQPIERMSYGWMWAWLGFCKSWTKVKQTYGMLRRSSVDSRPVTEWISFKIRLRNASVEAWNSTLWCHPITSRKIRIDKFLSW